MNLTSRMAMRWLGACAVLVCGACYKLKPVQVGALPSAQSTAVRPDIEIKLNTRKLVHMYQVHVENDSFVGLDRRATQRKPKRMAVAVVDTKEVAIRKSDGLMNLLGIALTLFLFTVLLVGASPA